MDFLQDFVETPPLSSSWPVFVLEVAMAGLLGMDEFSGTANAKPSAAAPTVVVAQS